MKNLQNGIVIELQIFAAVLETLLSAYEFIINRYIEYYMKNSLDMAIQKDCLLVMWEITLSCHMKKERDFTE